MTRHTLLEWLAAALLVFLVVVVFAQVALRYLTYQPLAWTEEAARICFIWLCLLSAAAATRRAGHFGVNLLERRLPSRPRRWLVAGLRIVEAGFFGVITWSGLVVTRVVHDQISPTLDVPMSWAYGAIPLAGLLMVLYNGRLALQALRSPEP